MRKKEMRILLQLHYAYWLDEMSPKNRAKLPANCPYTIEQFLDKNYFPPIIG